MMLPPLLFSAIIAQLSGKEKPPSVGWGQGQLHQGRKGLQNSAAEPAQQGLFFHIIGGYGLGQGHGQVKVIPDVPQGGDVIEVGCAFKMMVKAPVVQIDGPTTAWRSSHRNTFAWTKPGVYS